MSMGWKGYVSISGVSVPANTTGLVKAPNPQFGETVHAQGHVINYADGQNNYQGGVDFPLFTDMLSALKAFVITDRATTKSVILSPDGNLTYTYPDSGGKCLVKSLTIRGNMGGVITCSLDLVATGRQTVGAAPTFTATTTLNLNQTPIPYWKTSFVTTSFGSAGSTTQVTAWSITINNNQFVLYTFDGTNDPHDIQPGLLDVTGSVTLYDPSGAAIPTDGESVTLTLDTVSWNLNYLVYTSYPMNIPGPNTKVVRACAFRSIGDNTNAPIY